MKKTGAIGVTGGAILNFVVQREKLRLLIYADMWHGTLTCEGLSQDHEFKSLDACRAFAVKNGYKGIWIRFGITKYQVSIMVRKFRHQDQVLQKAGLSRKEIAGVRMAQRRREKVG